MVELAKILRDSKKEEVSDPAGLRRELFKLTYTTQQHEIFAPYDKGDCGEVLMLLLSAIHKELSPKALNSEDDICYDRDQPISDSNQCCKVHKTMFLNLI